MFEALQERVQDLRIYLSSTQEEAGRPWPTTYSTLNTVVQRTWIWKRRERHPHGFTAAVWIYVPVDTLAHLLHYRPQVTISAEMGFRTLQAAIYRKLSRSSRLILWATVSEVSEMGRGRIRFVLRKLLLKCADAVLVNGDSGARYVRQFGIGEDKIVRVPYTTEVEPFLRVARGPESGGVHRLLYIGQLIERKGLVRFYRAVCEWAERHPDRHILWSLVGNGPLEDFFKNVTSPANLVVKHYDNVPYNQLPGYCVEADILVLPTLADEWGIVVNEALASGLPVLGSIYSQAVEELIEDTKNGWHFRPDSADEIKSALERVFATTSETLGAMRVAARNTVARLSPAFAADQVISGIRIALRNDT
jgi:glycosyltransferase involved in cell wall biosynthesis